MKNLINLFVLLIILSYSHLNAQDQDFRRGSAAKSEYLLSSNVRISGFGGPFIEMGSMANDFAVMVGGGGGVLFDRSFFVGGFGQGLANERFYNVLIEGQRERRKLEVGMGGFWLGYSAPATKAVHFIGQLKVGFGGAQLVPDDTRPRNNDYPHDTFVALCPMAGVEFNLTPWFRLSLDGGYRFFFGGDLPGVDDLSGAFGGLTLRFGWFE